MNRGQTSLCFTPFPRVTICSLSAICSWRGSGERRDHLGFVQQSQCRQHPKLQRHKNITHSVFSCLSSALVLRTRPDKAFHAPHSSTTLSSHAAAAQVQPVTNARFGRRPESRLVREMVSHRCITSWWYYILRARKYPNRHRQRTMHGCDFWAQIQLSVRARLGNGPSKPLTSLCVFIRISEIRI